MATEQSGPERRKAGAILVGLDLLGAKKRVGMGDGDGGWTPEESLAELAELVATAGRNVVGQVIQRRLDVDPATYVGQGKAEEIAEQARLLGADAVIFDDELSPVQVRNLERLFEIEVADRTRIILEIFASRAHSREGKLQVELARLNYLLPRLTGRGQAMSRQAGGIGTRGVGETKLELDRRAIRRRIAELRRELTDVVAQRARLRAARREAWIPLVALVGYTNAGKSTLHDRLTGSGVLVLDQLFATLDPTTRRLETPDGPLLVSDTVGFIHKLPPGLVAAFRATLEEVGGADLLLQVVDASHEKWVEQLAEVRHTLAEIGAGALPSLVVMNKIDLLDPGRLLAMRRGHPGAVWISARTGEGIDGLLTAVWRALSADRQSVHWTLPYAQGWALHLVHAHGRVRSEAYSERGVEVEAELPRIWARAIEARLARQP